MSARLSVHQQAGFTLVEVMVAVGIIAFALPALMFGLMAQLDGTAYARDKSIANWVALNHMAELRLKNRASGKVELRDRSGKVEMADREWFWDSETEKLELGEGATEDLYKVTVRVKLKKDRDLIGIFCRALT